MKWSIPLIMGLTVAVPLKLKAEMGIDDPVKGGHNLRQVLTGKPAGNYKIFVEFFGPPKALSGVDNYQILLAEAKLRLTISNFEAPSILDPKTKYPVIGTVPDPTPNTAERRLGGIEMIMDPSKDFIITPSMYLPDEKRWVHNAVEGDVHDHCDVSPEGVGTRITFMNDFFWHSMIVHIYPMSGGEHWEPTSISPNPLDEKAATSKH